MSAPAPTSPSRRDPSALGRRALVALHERLLEPLGVTYCQQLVLVALEPGAMRRPALRARLLLSARAVEEAITPSLRSDLVRDELDGRGTGWGVLSLSDRGRSHLPRLVEIADEVRERSGTTAEERALLLRLIAAAA
ncbi:hypothetical protein [Clavibacter michiganensis]|uniref:hypothetical protein n=1 Tax=Clavibacter michiganensis TaxID=28447 RepID=UPI0005BC58C3|nr:hypothetical protein [Clavibacter michiganensis]